MRSEVVEPLPLKVDRDCSAEMYSVRRRKEIAEAEPVFVSAVWPSDDAERRSRRSRGSTGGVGSRGRIAASVSQEY